MENSEQVSPPQIPINSQVAPPKANMPAIIVAFVCLLGIGLLGGYLIANGNSTPQLDDQKARNQKVNANVAPGQNVPLQQAPSSDTTTAKHDGMTMTITPNSGTKGTLVSVTLEGVPPPPIFLEGGMIFIDSANGLGYIQAEDSGTKPTSPPDPTKPNKLTFTIKIPDTVYVRATQTEQKPSKAVPISGGPGRLRYLYNDGTTKSTDGGYPYVEIPFTITSPL